MTEARYVSAPFVIPEDFAAELRNAADLLDAGTKALQTAQSILAAMQTVGLDSEHKFVAHFIFTKALKTTHAVQVLCRCGCGSDGLSLCAVLFENVVDLLYIGMAPVRRSRRYCQFENVDKYFQARKILGYKRLPGGRRIVYKRYERNLHPQVAPFLKYFPKAGKGWAQKSLVERAKAVGAGLAYQELYWIFCAHKHTLPMSAVGLTASTTTGESMLTTGPDMKMVCHAAEQSITLLLRMCSMVDSVFGLSARAEIDAQFSELQAAISVVKHEHPLLFG
jgi:hypothetical protein